MHFFDSEISLATDSRPYRLYRWCRDFTSYFGCSNLPKHPSDLCTLIKAYAHAAAKLVGYGLLGAVLCAMVVLILAALAFIGLDLYGDAAAFFAQPDWTMSSLAAALWAGLAAEVADAAGAILRVVLGLLGAVGILALAALALHLTDKKSGQRYYEPPCKSDSTGLLKIAGVWLYDRAHKICRPIRITTMG